MRYAICLCLMLGLAGPALADAGWPVFPIIQWQARTPAQLATLKRMGVTAGAVIADREGDGSREATPAADLRGAGMRYYLENTATDFYAPYHRYTPGKSVNWLFEAARAAYRAHPDDTSLFQRLPSLSDQAWQDRIGRRLTEMVRRHRADHPLFYSLGDETGIADLSAYSDFDTSPASLEGMRDWLRGVYPSLAALNAEWGTDYRDWDAVQPELTRAAMRRTDGNFAPWSDFKAWMDEAFARALRGGTAAVHAADPTALTAIEGAQTPGWGGYDYTRLAHAVDVMEFYDNGENLPIVRSLNPRVIPLTTAFGDSPRDIHELWREVLRGARGIVIWDDDNGLVRPDGTPGPRAAAFGDLFAALHGRLGQALAGAVAVSDPVAILYSPESFRVQWMLDHRADGDAWMDRGADIENEDNAYRAALRGYVESLTRLHMQPRFVSSGELADGTVREKALILPDAIALSPAAASAVEAFGKNGGVVIADAQPGLFDGHGKRLPAPAVAHFDRVEPADTAALGRALRLQAPLRVDASEAIETHVYRQGGATLVALQTAAPRVAPVPVRLILADPETVRNVGTGETIPFGNGIDLTLDPIVPTLIEIGQ